jgi:GntP family gluconate:H+ symporter
MAPLLVLAIGVAFVVLAIGVFRCHAFLALLMAALLVGVLGPDPGAAPAHVADEMGVMFGKIGIVIAMAAIIGQCLLESGAADRITRTFTRLFGDRRASLGLLGSSTVLAVPVFFDTVFYLLVPLAKALRIRTGKDYVLYLVAISAGGIATHSLVPPTPGPLAVAAKLSIPLGQMILVGAVAALPAAILAGWAFGLVLNRRIEVPLREGAGLPLAEMEKLARKPDHELPPFWLSILPVVLPVVLIAGNTIAEATWTVAEGAATPAILEVSGFLGNPNFALLAAAVVALGLMLQQGKGSIRTLRDRIEPAVASAGAIILITAAGGAFGRMLVQVGVAGEIKVLAQDWSISLVVLGFALASIMKAAQGSSTVAMMTAAPLMAKIIEGTEALAYHPVYVALAVGAGAVVPSWMNDSGFWVVMRMGGLTEGETLKVWTVLTVVVGLLAFVTVLVMMHVVPFPFAVPAAPRTL